MFWGPWSDICKGHSCHGGELMFVFNNIIAIQNATEEERTLASKMNAYWSNFIVTGDPSTNNADEAVPLPALGSVDKASVAAAAPRASNLTQWPAYVADQKNWMNFSDANPEPIAHFKDDKCALWDSIGYYREPGIL